MSMTILMFLSSGLFLGWSLGANDAANVFGTAVGTRMVKFVTAAIVCSVFIILGATIDGAGAAHTLGKLGAVNAIGGSFMVAFSAAFTVYWMTKLGVPVSTSQAVVGAIIGWNIYSGNVTDTEALIKIMSTWVACPILSGLVAIPLYLLVKGLLKLCNFHLLHLDAVTRISLIIAGAFGSYALGANNIANVMGVFVPVSPFTDFTVNGTQITGIQQLFFLGAVAISVGVFTYSKRVMLTVGDGIMAMTPVVAWVVVIAQSVVLFLFASEGLEHFLATHHLPTIPLVPVSSSQAVVGAVMGIGLLKGGRGMKWSVLGRISSGWVTTPVISALICFVALFFLQNVFNQKVYHDIYYDFSPAVVEKLHRENIDTSNMKSILGKKIKGSVALKETLAKNGVDDDKLASKIIDIAEISRVYVSPEHIGKLDYSWYGDEKMDAIRHLSGRRYKYKWQFTDDLEDLDSSWKKLPSSIENKLANKAIKERREAVIREFKVNK